MRDTHVRHRCRLHHMRGAPMESADLLRRLERRESDLSFRITHLRKELDDLETAVTRISIAREEVRALEAIGELSTQAGLAASVDNTAVAPSLEITPMQLVSRELSL